jgi:hypothetical protein
MNKLILSILIYSTLLCAQDKSSNPMLPKNSSDTVKISDLVEKQIASAREKQLQSQFYKSDSVRPTISVIEKSNFEQIPVVTGNSSILNQPLHVQLFGICSIAVILFVLIRRVGFIYKRSSRLSQKKNIQMLREEKITSSPLPKLQYSRRNLRNSELVLKGSEKHISRTAKDLKIAKGELVLAARLKLFEVGKM